MPSGFPLDLANGGNQEEMKIRETNEVGFLLVGSSSLADCLARMSLLL